MYSATWNFTTGDLRERNRITLNHFLPYFLSIVRYGKHRIRNSTLIFSWLLHITTTSVRVPKMGETGFPPAIIFFLCKNPVKRAIARPSIRSGTIVRVRLKFVLNKHWNQYFYYANFTSAIGFYENFKVTLTMVPDRFENRATAHLIEFKQRKQMMVGGKPVSADSGTLTFVTYT